MKSTLIVYVLIIITFIWTHLLIPYKLMLLIPEWFVLQLALRNSAWKALGGLLILLSLYLTFSALPTSYIIGIYSIWFLSILLLKRSLHSYKVIFQMMTVFLYMTLLVIFQYQAIYGIIVIIVLSIHFIFNTILYGALYKYCLQNDWTEKIFL
jgi:hypothetical protein